MGHPTPMKVKAKCKASSNRSSQTEQHPNRRSLLDLPAELWSRICIAATIPDEPLTIPLDATSTDYTRLLRQPGITRTCRIIRAETLQYFYNSAIIQIAQRSGHDDLDLLTRWLDAIDEENRRSIRTVPFGSLQQYVKKGAEILIVPLKIQCPPGFAALEQYEDDGDIVASVKRYVLGPEPISI